MNYLPKDKKGLIRVGGPVSRTTASLRISGDDLDPDEITALLRCAPARSHRKGDVHAGKPSDKKYIEKSGMWSLAASKTAQENHDRKIVDLLTQVTDDVQIWHAIKSPRPGHDQPKKADTRWMSSVASSWTMVETVPAIETEGTSQKLISEVMLFFDQANRSPGKEKGRTGDKAIVPAVCDKALPVCFRSGFNDLK